MTTLDTPADHVVAAPAAVTERGGAATGVAAWLATTDHKRIGRLFIGVGLVVLVATIVVAALAAIERADDSGAFLGLGTAPQLMAALRVGLVFGSALPLVLGVAVAIVPLQIGARSITFARVALLGFWSWFVGMALVIVAIANDGGPGGGDGDMVDLYLVGLGMVAVGLAAVAGSLVTTVMTARAPGMTLGRVPFLAWSALVTGIGILLTMPVLVGDLIYLFVDHRNARVAFEGNAGIQKWSGWALTQPQTYVYAIIAIGIFAEVMPLVARARQPHRAGVLAGLALIGTAALAGVTQTQHVVTWDVDRVGDTAQSAAPYLLFNGLPVLGVLIVLALGLLVLRQGRPRTLGAAVLALAGLLMVVTGMIGHLVYSVDVAGLQGTVFEEAELVYLGYGAILGALAGLALWSPKLWGRRMPDGAVAGLGALGLLAVILASLPFYFAGFADQPASVLTGFTNEGPTTLWNVAVAAGHVLFLIVVLLFVGLVIGTRRSGDEVGDDPWEGQTLEWATTSPPPDDNFAAVPTVRSAEPLYDTEPTRSDA